MPFFTDFIGQGLSSAKPSISYTMGPRYLLLNSFSAQKGWKLSFMLMLTILTAWAFIKSRRNWIIYGLGLFACFLSIVISFLSWLALLIYLVKFKAKYAQ